MISARPAKAAAGRIDERRITRARLVVRRAAPARNSRPLRPTRRSPITKSRRCGVRAGWRGAPKGASAPVRPRGTTRGAVASCSGWRAVPRERTHPCAGTVADSRGRRGMPFSHRPIHPPSRLGGHRGHTPVALRRRFLQARLPPRPLPAEGAVVRGVVDQAPRLATRCVAIRRHLHLSRNVSDRPCARRTASQHAAAAASHLRLRRRDFSAERERRQPLHQRAEGAQ